jgi:hypothetical protein
MLGGNTLLAFNRGGFGDNGLLAFVFFAGWLFSFFLLFPFGLLFEFFSAGSHKLVYFLFLLFPLIFHEQFGLLQFGSLSLPLHYLIGNDINDIRIFDTGGDVILEFVRVALSLEIGVEQNFEVSE